MLGDGTPILEHGTHIPGYKFGDHKKIWNHFCFFDGYLFWFLAVYLCPISMYKHEVGLAHTNEIACKK
jgi:hypothetical protein